MTVAASTVATYLDATHTGPDTTVTGVDALQRADGDDLAFSTYEDVDPVERSAAGIILCRPSIPTLEHQTQIPTRDPELAFARVADEFFVPDRTGTRIHPTAWVADDATLGTDCTVGPNAVIGDAATLGDTVTVQAGAVIGTPGFGFVRDDTAELHHQPHVGGVELEDDVTVGPNTSIDRGMFSPTRIGSGTKLSGNVHVAHHADVGADVTVAYGSGFAGGATIGDRTTVHPHVSVATDIDVGTAAELGTNATVLDDVPAETVVVGSPAEPIENDP